MASSDRFPCRLRAVAAKPVAATMLGAFLLMGITTCKPPPGHRVPPRRSDPCEDAASEQKRLANLVADGKLDRAWRTIEAADEACPETEARRARVKMAIAEALALGAARPDRQEAFELVRRGLDASRKGDRPEAQRLFDRARHALFAEGTSRVVFFHAHRAFGFGGGVAVEGTVAPVGDHAWAWLTDGTWPAPARLRGGGGLELVAGGMAFRHDGRAWWAPSPMSAAVADVDVVAAFGGQVVARHLSGVVPDGIAVLDRASGDVIARAQGPARDVHIRGDVVVTMNGSEAASFSLPSLQPIADVTAAAFVIDPHRPRLVAIASGSERLAAARLVDMASGTVESRFELPTTFHEGAHALRDDALAVTTHDGVTLIDTRNGLRSDVALPWSFPKGRATWASPGFTADGRHLCLAMNDQRFIIDLRRRHPLQSTRGVAYSCRFLDRPDAIVAKVPLAAGHRLVVDAVARRPYRGTEMPLALAVTGDGQRGAALTERSGGPHRARQLLLLDLEQKSVIHREVLDAPSNSASSEGDLRIVAGIAWVRRMTPTGGFEERGWDLATGQEVNESTPPDTSDAKAGEVASPIGAQRLYPMDPDDGDLVFQSSRHWDLRRGCFRSSCPSGKHRSTPSFILRRGGYGVVEVWRQAKQVADVLVVGPEGAVALLADGRVDHLGATGSRTGGLVCVGDDVMLPYQVCEERWRDDGALARLLRAGR